MISKQEASELIFAGVLGCLDLADQKKLNEYIKAHGELPSTFGEFQNIAAMLPVILNPESPDAQLKDKVARKLYRIKDEIRSKTLGDAANTEDFYKNSRRDRRSGSSETPKFRTDEKKTEPDLKEIKKTPVTDAENAKVKEEKKEIPKPEEFETVTPSRSTFESFKSTREKVLEGKFAEERDEKMPSEIKSDLKPQPEENKTSDREIKDKIPHKTASTEIPYYKKVTTKERGKSLEKSFKKKFTTAEIPEVKKSPLYFWGAISLLVILILAIAVIYLNFSSEIKDLQLTNESLTQRLNDLSVKFSSTQEIQDFIESADVKIIPLKGTGINPEGNGKLIISISKNKGYLQLTDMPVLSQDKSYQLWMQMPSGGYYSLGVFNPAGRIQYFPFSLPQSVIENVHDFLVTEETSGGASRPGNNVFLSGSF